METTNNKNGRFNNFLERCNIQTKQFKEKFTQTDDAYVNFEFCKIDDLYRSAVNNLNKKIDEAFDIIKKK